jgi:(p)ppGpp synthase/HD superfamily hydrolase
MPTPWRAQTNLQLFHQFHQTGASAQEMRVLRDGYLLAMQLDAGFITGGGKPTLCHVVGSASLARHHGAPFDVATAALIHDAYVVGDWGRLRRRISEEMRAEVRGAIGPRAESYLYAFTHLSRQPRDLEALAERTEPLTESEQGAVLVLLFELLDHLLDLGSVLFFRDVERSRARFREQRASLCILADRCGFPALRADLEDAIDHALTAELPPDLVGLAFPGDSAPQLIPRSCRRRYRLRLAWALADALRRVGVLKSGSASPGMIRS